MSANGEHVAARSGKRSPVFSAGSTKERILAQNEGAARAYKSMKRDADREVVIFTEALKLPYHERGPFLQRRCDGDDELRVKVEALLKAHDRLGNFLEEPPTWQ